MQYLDAGFYPILAPAPLMVVWRGKLTYSILPDISEQYKAKSLRCLAREYGVSHEAISPEQIKDVIKQLVEKAREEVTPKPRDPGNPPITN